jgi:hypothetical protein
MVRNGATFATRSRGSRTYIRREPEFTASESRKLLSVFLMANTSRRKNEPIGTPPSPSYV